MSQHDFDLANQSFPDFRADANSALAALASNSAGNSAPSSPTTYQFWLDTSASPYRLKIYDGTDWIIIGALDPSNNRWRFGYDADGDSYATYTADDALSWVIAGVERLTLDAGGLGVAGVNNAPSHPPLGSINDDFQIWQEATSFSDPAGEYVADMYKANVATGGGGAGTFSLGSWGAVANGRRYAEFDVTSGSTNAPSVTKIVPDLKRFYGRKITVSVYGERTSGSDVTCNVNALARYGTTGGASAAENLDTGSITLTDTPAWHSVTLDLGLFTGKTFGTDQNDRLDLQLVFPTSTAFTVRLGVFTWSPGEFRQPFIARPLAHELADCRFFYQAHEVRATDSATAEVVRAVNFNAGVMRAAPSVSFTPDSGSGAAFTARSQALSDSVGPVAVQVYQSTANSAATTGLLELDARY